MAKETEGIIKLSIEKVYALVGYPSEKPQSAKDPQFKLASPPSKRETS